VVNDPSPRTHEDRSTSHVAALDGVRAVAVALVILFHLRVPGFEAGFLGVDIFFVLSGFLITSLVLEEIDRTGRISLPAFWARRVRRLLPALVVVMLTVAAVTWWTASFTEMSSVRSDLLATTAYVGNWRFIDTSSYFNNTGIESPLEHTWSLAIEEQFYLVWPLALTALGLLSGWRRPRLAIGVVAGVGVVFSALLLGALWEPSAVERAYMGTDSRVFEPLLGALGAVIVASPTMGKRLDRAGTVLAVGGAAGLIAALWLIRPERAIYYRGGALFVSLMTLAIVAALWRGRGGRLRSGLSWEPVAWIGAISYGIYLWHWPVALWLGVREATPTFPELRMAGAVVVTIGIATLSFYWVEQPFRGRSSGRHADRRRQPGSRWVLAAAPLTLVVIAGLSLAATDVPEPSRGVPVVMLVGDSVPHHLEVTVEEGAEERGWRVVSAAHGSCPVTGETVTYQDGTPVRGADICSSQIVAEQDALIDQNDPDLVLWWDRWSVSSYITGDGQLAESGSSRFWRQRRQALDLAVARLAAEGATVVFMAVEPPGSMIATRCSDERCNEWVQFQVTHYDDITSRWNGMLRRYAERHPGSTAFITITDVVCRDDSAPCDDSLGGIPARPDGTHYEGDGAELAADTVLTLLAQRMSSEPAVL
jgi:peptidoglycan/LPS O-acetylase OafA/YrhL